MGNWPSVWHRRSRVHRHQPVKGKHQDCSGYTPKRKQAPRIIESSRAADPTALSFLDLPPELRNIIYTHHLVIDGYVRIGKHQPTRIPGLVLLRTCKQVHDEVASLFYAANSFYCLVEKRAEGGDANKSIIDDGSDVAASYLRLPSEEADRRVVFPQGGVFFPAPRYHIWLTRLTIDVRVDTSRAWHKRPPALTEQELWRQHMYGLVREGMEGVYRAMREEWEAKDGEWEGRLQGSERDRGRGSTYRCWTISFAVGEREEIATKAALRPRGARHRAR